MGHVKRIGSSIETVSLLGPQKNEAEQFLSGGIHGDVGQARDRNGDEQVRPQFESASQTRY